MSDNNILTPSKRKREDSQQNDNDNVIQQQNIDIQFQRYLNNQREQKQLQQQKQQHYPYYNSYLEIKSIADCLPPINSLKEIQNPYEIIRKPIKKKKLSVDDFCYTNPGLNLNSAKETIINPLEVKRTDDSIGGGQSIEKCGYINSAFNIKCPEKEQCNPFEITRHVNQTVEPLKKLEGIENQGLDLQQPIPSNLTLAIPFTPTVGCRIDFNDISLTNFTTKVILNDNVEFLPETRPQSSTPKDNLYLQQKQDLSIITEEEPVDIDKELDCYQLELENSINEGKILNKKQQKNLIHLKHIRNVSLQQLKNDNDFNLSLNSDNINANDHTPKIESNNENIASEIQTEIVEIYENIEVKPINNNDQFDDDDDDLDKPTVFVRGYRRSLRNAATNPTTTNTTKNSNENVNNMKFSIIRRSLRKITKQYKKQSLPKTKTPEVPSSPSSSDADVKIKNKPNDHQNIFTSIRHSFRKKIDPASLTTANYKNNHDISIVAGENNRKIFKDITLRNDLHHQHHHGTDDLAFNRTASIRNSLRKSTKDVRKHVMKSVFQQKSKEYNLDK